MRCHRHPIVFRLGACQNNYSCTLFVISYEGSAADFLLRQQKMKGRFPIHSSWNWPSSLVSLMICQWCYVSEYFVIISEIVVITGIVLLLSNPHTDLGNLRKDCYQKEKKKNRVEMTSSRYRVTHVDVMGKKPAGRIPLPQKQQLT